MTTISKSPAAGPLSRERERERVGVRERARTLRHEQTDAEAMLWSHLRDRRLGNFKFRRQRPIGAYFADFACLEAMLVVELDGGQHADAAEYDQSRTQFMQRQGFRVLRFWNNDVLTQTDIVRDQILLALHADPHPNPLPAAGEGVRTLTPALSRLRESE